MRKDSLHQYVLPSESKKQILDLPKPLDDTTLQIEAQTDQGDVTASVLVSSQ